MRRIATLSLLMSLLSGAAHAAPEAAPGVVLVRWRASMRTAERASVREALGATVDREYAAIGVERLELSAVSVEEALLRLAQDPRVEFAEPDFLVRVARVPDDPRFPEQWALQNTGQSGGTAGADVRAVRGWDIGTDARAVVVGVVDTGADLLHPDLAANLWVNAGEIAGNGLDDDANGYVDDVHGYDFLNRDGDPSDDYGHGTHVSGIIAARGDNGIGVSGVAWQGRVMVLKFLGSNGSGPTSAAVEAILYATRMGAHIVNHSWGGGPYSQTLYEAFQAAGRAGVLSVIAAGNQGVDLDVQPVYPASFDDPTILTVAATDESDALAPFSNRGAISVHVAAPGTAILSLAPRGQYSLNSGTSMAAPLVAGAMALLLAHEPSLDAIALRQRMIASALPLPSLLGRTVSGGRLDLVRLLSTPEDEPPSRIVDLRVDQIGSHAAWLEWTAPGDDGDLGRADRYLLRIATGPVGSVPFEAMSPVPSPEPSEAGFSERVRIGGLEAETAYWAQVRAMDDQGNAGALSSPVEFTTRPPPRASLDVTLVESDLPAGESERHVVMLSNPSSGTLEWSFARPQLETSGGGPASTEGYEVWGLGAGPKPRFDWVAPGAEAAAVALEGDEGLSAPIELPFPFPYFGLEYRSFRISSNGFLTFLGEDPAPQPVALPSPLAPPSSIAPFWADLDPGPSERRVWIQSDPLRVVITWQETHAFGSPAEPLTFQVWMLRTGEVRFQYLTLSGRSSIASAGLQGPLVSKGVRVAFREATLGDSLAIRLRPSLRWARAAPVAGVLGPGESTPITIDLETRGLGDGVQQGVLSMLTDSPVEPALGIEARVLARAAPHLVASHTALDFGIRPRGREAVRLLSVANEGALSAQVGSVRVVGQDFATPDVSFTLEPGEARSLPVHFLPTQATGLSGVLSVHSDDPQLPRADVVLSGEALEPPEFVLSEASVTGIAAAGARAGAERDQRVLTLANPGGMALPWRLSAIAGARPEPPLDGLSAAPHALGGPDAAGYRWRSSEEPGAPPFEWLEIRDVGRRLFGGADDSVHTGLPLPFEFPFYGRTFAGISVCTNGWMAFESTTPLREGRPLPDPAAPLGLIAPFWADLDARITSGAGGIFAHERDGRFIVEWTEVRRFGTAERFSFQVWLWPDGRIDYLYRSMSGTRAGATIGLQDADGLRGSTIAHETALARDSLRLSIRATPDWLTASRYAGVLQPGETDTLHIALAATALESGRWTGALRFESEALEPRVVSLPCTLLAGATPMEASVAPRRWRAASEQPFVEFEADSEATRPGVLWLDDVPLEVVEAQPLPSGRVRIRVEADRLMPALATGDTPRRFALRSPTRGWRVADLPLEVLSLPLEVSGLPGEAEAPPAEQVAGETRTLAWVPSSAGSELAAWLRTAPGVWERLASSDGPGIELRWPRALAAARIELVESSAGEVVGVWRSAAFAIREGSAPALPERLALALRGAHPARPPVALELSLPAASVVRADVFDARGARVRELVRASFVAGRHSLVWDGRLSRGEAAAPGVYLIRARTGSGDITRRVVLLGRP